MKVIATVILLLALAPGLVGSDKTFDTFRLSYVTLDYIDVSMSLYGVKKGYRETNPLARWYIKSPPLAIAVHTATNIALVAISGYLYKRNKKLGWAFVIGINLFKAYIVYRNFKILTRKR